MTTQMQSGSTLRGIRLDMGVTGVAVARALGYSKAAVSQIERRSRLRPDTFTRYSVAITKAALRHHLGREDVSPELKRVGLLLNQRLVSEQLRALAKEEAALEHLLGETGSATR